MTQFNIAYEALTQPGFGNANRHNEDAVLAGGCVYQQACAIQGCSNTAAGQMFAISDGLHGTPSAAFASRNLLRDVASLWLSNADMAPARKIETLHKRHQDAAHGYSRRAGMACTLVAAEFGERLVTVYHVGDSRAWLLRGDGIQRLTQDHTTLRSMERQGLVRVEQLKEYASIYHSLDNYFMASPYEQPPHCDVIQFEIESDDRLILASDGITMLSDSEIATARGCNLGRTGEALSDVALAKGSDDDISIIVVHVT